MSGRPFAFTRSWYKSVTDSKVRMDELSKQRHYSRDFQAFAAVYDNLQRVGLLPAAQQGWHEAAGEIAGQLKLTPAQQRAVYRLPQDVALDAAAIAAHPKGQEAFYRMELLTMAAEDLTATLANDSQRTRRWLKIRHAGGPYQARRPLQVVMHGANHELKLLREYVRPQ